MKALLLVHHPLKADQGLSTPVALETSQERAIVGNSWPLVEMLRPIYCWRSAIHLSDTSKGHQEHGQEGPAAHMLTQ